MPTPPANSLMKTLILFLPSTATAFLPQPTRSLTVTAVPLHVTLPHLPRDEADVRAQLPGPAT